MSKEKEKERRKGSARETETSLSQKTNVVWERFRLNHDPRSGGGHEQLADKFQSTVNGNVNRSADEMNRRCGWIRGYSTTNRCRLLSRQLIAFAAIGWERSTISCLFPSRRQFGRVVTAESLAHMMRIFQQQTTTSTDSLHGRDQRPWSATFIV